MAWCGIGISVEECKLMPNLNMILSSSQDTEHPQPTPQDSVIGTDYYSVLVNLCTFMLS